MVILVAVTAVILNTGATDGTEEGENRRTERHQARRGHEMKGRTGM